MSEELILPENFASKELLELKGPEKEYFYTWEKIFRTLRLVMKNLRESGKDYSIPPNYAFNIKEIWDWLRTKQSRLENKGLVEEFLTHKETLRKLKTLITSKRREEIEELMLRVGSE